MRTLGLLFMSGLLVGLSACSDKEEVDCVSNPLDEAEQCYACGWAHNDPGDIESTGSEIGDVMANLQLEDQCGDVVDTWDFYGEYHVLYMTAAW